jgi:hypothetical protein
MVEPARLRVGRPVAAGVRQRDDAGQRGRERTAGGKAQAQHAVLTRGGECVTTQRPGDRLPAHEVDRARAGALAVQHRSGTTQQFDPVVVERIGVAHRDRRAADADAVEQHGDAVLDEAAGREHARAGQASEAAR